jgi:hypothetical protein
VIAAADLGKASIPPERYPVGATDWRPLGGHPGPIPVRPDLSQALSAVGSLRRDDENHDYLARELSTRGAIDVGEAFIDASFAPAKKGGTRSEKPNVARGRRSWRSLIVIGCPFSVYAESATPHEVTLAMPTLLPTLRRT